MKNILNDCNRFEYQQGSALVTVLVLVVIASVLLGAVFGGIRLQRAFIQRDIDQQKALYLAEAGVWEYLAGVEDPSALADSTFDVTLSKGGSAELQTIRFGGYLRVSSEATAGRDSVSVEFLVGSQPPEDFSYAVVLGDTASPLTLAGTTDITGDIKLSQQGIKQASFKGVPFRGSFNGEQVSQKGTLLPRFSPAYLDQQITIFENMLSGSPAGFTQPEPNELIRQMRSSPGDTLRVNGNYNLISTREVAIQQPVYVVVRGNLSLNGPFAFSEYTRLIVSDTLKVGGSITGSNLVFYAGKSLLAGGAARFSGQLLSSGSVTIRDNAYLGYPGLMYTQKEFINNRQQEVIELRNQAVVDGMVIYPYQPNEVTREFLRIKIGENALLRGAVYTQGQTELEGQVYGSVLTNQFYFFDSPTNYINWLKDVRINHSQRPKQFVVPLGFAPPVKYAVLDWKVLNEL